MTVCKEGGGVPWSLGLSRGNDIRAFFVLPCFQLVIRLRSENTCELHTNACTSVVAVDVHFLVTTGREERTEVTPTQIAGGVL